MSKQKPRFVFWGTPHFAVNVLNALEAHGLLPALIITSPDRPRGRGLEVTPSPAKAWGMERGIDVLTPEKIKDETFVQELQNTDWDVFVVAAYAKLIPKTILDIPRRGCLNVHPSLLPKFRGPSPTVSAILADARTTGVSIMLMDERMDEGPVVAQGRVELDAEDWPPKGSVFEDLLATEGGNLLAETLEPWIAGEVEPEPQNHTEATYTKKFSDSDSLINLQGDPYQELLKIRAFDNPLRQLADGGPRGQRAHFFDTNGKRIIITEAELVDGKLKILKVIPEGRKEQTYIETNHS